MITWDDKIKIVESMTSYPEDIRHDFFVKELETARDKEFVSKSEYRRYAHSRLSKLNANAVWTENNRRRLEAENADAILQNTTPTLSGRAAAGPEEFADCEETLVRRWNRLSSYLKAVAKRSYFGYMESPEKIARDLRTTVASVNMARTRIKKIMNGVD